VFFHQDTFNNLFPQGTYFFYIGRPGCQPNECFDWKKENIAVTAFGSNEEWGECRVLIAPGGAQVRVNYEFDGSTRTKELVFPKREEERISDDAIYL